MNKHESELKLKLNRVRNKANSIIKVARADYFFYKTEEHKKNPKKV